MKLIDRWIDRLADAIADRLAAAGPSVHIENVNVPNDDRYTDFERALMAKRAQSWSHRY